MATKEELTEAYIDFVLTEGMQPRSVYVFSKSQGITETDFYAVFPSFEALEQRIWTDLGNQVVDEIRGQEIWTGYTAREKLLSFFYGFFELLKSKRSFAVYSVSHAGRGIGTPRVFEGLRDNFMTFSAEILNEGLASGELHDRKFFTDRYKNALWLQFVFILHFWIRDNSEAFEKTDEAIEKGINLTFDLFQRSPIDNLFEYGKFLVQNSELKEFFKFI